MVEYHVHDNFYSAVVGFADEIAPLSVGAETRVDAVVVGCGVAVVRSAGHVVFEHGVDPYRRNAETVDISEMLLHAGYIAAVARVEVGSVDLNGIFESARCFGIGRAPARANLSGIMR